MINLGQIMSWIVGVVQELTAPLYARAVVVH
jgi:hypothetical protein